MELPFAKKDETLAYVDDEHKMLWANSDNLTRLLYDSKNRVGTEKSMAEAIDASVVGMLKGLKTVARRVKAAPAGGEAKKSTKAKKDD